MLSRIWLEASARVAERRLRRRGSVPYEDLIRRYAPSRSFADIGSMWGINGANAFLAEEVGATSVTAFDAMEATEEFADEHRRRGSNVRFVRGDLHAAETPADVGMHDVVWCSGLMYHTPSPMLALERLGTMAREFLIVGTKSIPEVPDVPGMAVFFPALGQRERARFRRIWGAGVAAPFNPDPVMSYANWWWGLTRSALTGMLGLGWDVVDVLEGPMGTARDNLFVVAKRRGVPG